MKSALISAILLLAFAAHADPGGPLGLPPDLGQAVADLPARHRLPPLRDGVDSPLAARLDRLQMGRRARLLQLTSASAMTAWHEADVALDQARSRLDAPFPATVRSFTGRRASQLNALLKDRSVSAVRVLGPRLEVDEPVLLRRDRVWLDLGRTELHASGPGPRFLFRVEGAEGVTIDGGTFVDGQWGVLVHRGRDVTLRGGRFQGQRHGGVVLTDTVGAVLGRARLSGIGGAPILIHGRSLGAVVTEVEAIANLGASNWHAGIVISDRKGPVEVDPHSIFASDRYWVVEQPIHRRLDAPRRSVLAFNRIALNASSGIYSDGSLETVVMNNLVEGNSKEGICLDNGTTANVLASNRVRLNGKRWGKTDAQLRLDFVDGMGRLADGSAAAKTPGISLDNALYNIVYANHVEHNFGGGVKMVRTAFFNTVGLNLLTDNNEGANQRFHFFGIELGAARADAPSSELDFVPSQGNIIFGNTLRGSHYAGIYFGAGSTDNDTFDNTIFGATHWALEQAEAQHNPSLNNLTNLPSRHIAHGLDPRLLAAP